MEQERFDLNRRIRELNRKVDEFAEDVKIMEETNLDLKGDKSRL